MLGGVMMKNIYNNPGEETFKCNSVHIWYEYSACVFFQGSTNLTAEVNYSVSNVGLGILLAAEAVIAL